MEAKSIITRPSGGQQLSAPGFHEITGIAWSGHGKIKRVEVSVDGGKSWQEAQLQEPVLTRALTRFRLPWQWDGKPAVIQSRADRRDRLCAADAWPSCSRCAARIHFYHNNAIWPWRIARRRRGDQCATLEIVSGGRRCMRAGLRGTGRTAQSHVWHRAAGDGTRRLPAGISTSAATARNLPPGSGSVAHGQRGVRAAMRGVPRR